MREILIRKATPEDLKDINDFYNEEYNSNRSWQQFKWQFIDNPLGPAIFYIATKNDKIIGTVSSIPYMLTDKFGNKILTAKREQSIVTSEFRGQGIYQELLKAIISDLKTINVEYLWAVSQAIKSSKKGGFTSLGSIFSSYLIFDQKSFNEEKGFKGIKKVFVSLLSLMNRGWYSLSRNKTLIEVENWLEDNSLVTFNQGSISAHEIRVETSVDFLRWKTILNPYYKNSDVFLFKDDRDSRVVFIVHIDANKIATIDYCGFLSWMSLKVKQQYLKRLIITLFKKNVSAIKCWHIKKNQTNRELISIFKNLGFFMSKGNNELLFVSLVGDESDKDLIFDFLLSDGTS